MNKNEVSSWGLSIVCLCLHYSLFCRSRTRSRHLIPLNFSHKQYFYLQNVLSRDAITTQRLSLTHRLSHVTEKQKQISGSSLGMQHKNTYLTASMALQNIFLCQVLGQNTQILVCQAGSSHGLCQGHRVDQEQKKVYRCFVRSCFDPRAVCRQSSACVRISYREGKVAQPIMTNEIPARRERNISLVQTGGKTKENKLILGPLGFDT